MSAEVFFAWIEASHHKGAVDAAIGGLFQPVPTASSADLRALEPLYTRVLASPKHRQRLCALVRELQPQGANLALYFLEYPWFCYKTSQSNTFPLKRVLDIIAKEPQLMQVHDE